MWEFLSWSQAGVCELQLPSRCSGGLCFITENAALGFFLCSVDERGKPGGGTVSVTDRELSSFTFAPLGLWGEANKPRDLSASDFTILQDLGSQTHVQFLRYTGVCRCLLS